jgi:ribosomal-protein-alanine N-acetyltransferase
MERLCFSDPWSMDAVRETLEDNNVSAVGAFDEAHSLVGFGIVYVAADEADIADIAVEPHRRKAGIGRALLNELLAVAAKRGAASV